MMRHVVAFRFKDSVSPDQAQAILDQLSTFPDLHPQMRNWSLGSNVSTRDQSMSHSFMVEFDDEAALMTYLSSQAHESFVTQVWRPAIERQTIVTVDTSRPETVNRAMETSMSAVPARPHGPYGMAYARIEVPDLSDSINFFQYHVGLQLEGHDDTYAHLRCGTEHHCLDLVASPGRTAAEVTAIGLTVESPEVLEQIRQRIIADGRETFELSERIAPWVTSGFSVKDPNGLTLELVYEFQVYAERPLLEWCPVDIVHPFLSTPHYEECQHFYMDVLGFLPSDYIVSDRRGASSFIRSEDRYHHSWALRRDDRFYVAHIAFMMKNLDHVMRGRARAIYKGINIPSDIVNHSASRSIAFYMQEPQHGPRFELMDGHRVFSPEDHETWRGRKMSADPRNIDVWRPAADDWERF